MLKNERFEMLTSDVNMSDITDGFRFIRHVAFNTNIPIIMISNDGENNKVMRGLECGACNFLPKPIKPKDVQFIWQHVYRKRIHQIEGGKEDSRTTEIGRDGSIAGNKRGGESGGDTSSPKKPRLIWTKELHHKFKKAVEIYGPNCPKKILELMGTKSVTREQVASHLQKHRLNLARDSEKEALANMNLQNQVANRINHYQGQQCVQNLQMQCESNDGYSSNQLEFRMPQPAQDYSVLSDERFHAPPRLTGFPAVPQHINPHATMMRSNNEQNVEFSNVVDSLEPLSTFSNMGEQNVETGCYNQNQISSSSLPDAFGYSDPNTNTEEFSFSLDELFNMVYSPQHPNTFGGSDPNHGVSDPSDTYPKE